MLLSEKCVTVAGKFDNATILLADCDRDLSPSCVPYVSDENSQQHSIGIRGNLGKKIFPRSE